MISKTDAQNIQHAVQLLKNGELVAIPTETVYGLAGNAFSEKAVKSIYELKNRPAINPLIVHVKSKEAIEEIAINIPKEAILLAEKFWPGPLTLLLEKKDHVPSIVTAGKKTVGVRVPNHELTLELLRTLDFPLVAPSANRSNHISPTDPMHVHSSFEKKGPFVLDGGQCMKGIESTIIGFDKGEVVLYRHGTIAKEEIEKVLEREIKSFVHDESAPSSPGMLKKHYSPDTPLLLSDDIMNDLSLYNNKKIAVICFKKLIKQHEALDQRILSQNGELDVAASNLYSTLHELDSLNYDLILVERVPHEGIGVAINDRLSRASFTN